MTDYTEIINYYQNEIEKMVSHEMGDAGAKIIMEYVAKIIDNARSMQMELDQMREELDRVNAVEHIKRIKGWDEYPEAMGR